MKYSTKSLTNYLHAIVDPTVQDFAERPASVRHAFLACVAVFHSVDYVTRSKPSATLRGQWRRESPDFAEVDRVAHAFKHMESDRESPLKASAVISRPPAMAGIMEAGLSLCGDMTGAVVLTENTAGNLLVVVRRAAAFVHEKARQGSVRVG